MTDTVLILSLPHDLHAHAMCEAIERKGGTVRFFYTPDFPERIGLTIVPSIRGASTILHDSRRVELGADCVSVWLRRTSYAMTPQEFEEDDWVIIERESRLMRSSFFELLCPEALWVNPLRGHQVSKPAQLIAALQCGFRIPSTLVSNDPAEIMAFVKAASGPVVYKTFGAVVPTTVVTADLLADPEMLRWTPGIYQRYVEKAYELRVTVVGRRIFAVRINSQDTARGRIDWREAQLTPRGQPSDLAFNPTVLPKSMERRCLRLLEALGLAFGAIDLIVTPQGKYVFLEINPAGQFLWIDSALGLPLLDAMSEMLIQGRLAYDWNPQAPGLHFNSEFERAAEARRGKAMAEHITELRP